MGEEAVQRTRAFLKADRPGDQVLPGCEYAVRVTYTGDEILSLGQLSRGPARDTKQSAEASIGLRLGMAAQE
jgi:hypothetical protein